MLIMSFGCLRFSREPCSLYAFLLGYLPSIFLRFFLQNLLTFICRTLFSSFWNAAGSSFARKAQGIFPAKGRLFIRRFTSWEIKFRRSNVCMIRWAGTILADDGPFVKSVHFCLTIVSHSFLCNLYIVFPDSEWFRAFPSEIFPKNWSYSFIIF